MKRLIDVTVFFGFVIAWRFAGSPTLRSPFPLSRKATIEGVVLRPSLFAITTGSLPSITATHELVVPKSIPIIFPICSVFFVLKAKTSTSMLMPMGFYAIKVTQWHSFVERSNLQLDFFRVLLGLRALFSGMSFYTLRLRN